MKTLVLCGGKGTRLRPVTEKIPKPMVCLKDKPIIDHIISYFIKYGFNEFVLAIGYKGDIIKNYFKKNKGKAKIELSDSGDCSIMRRIINAKDVLGDRFIVIYGDTIADVDIKKLLKFHESKNGLVTITTSRMKSPFGIVESSEDGTINDFKEKPMLNHWINIGFMVFEQEALEFFNKSDDLISFLKKLIKEGKLYEYKHKGKHITINTHKEKEESEEKIIHFYTYRKGDKL
ncbi:glucose-1-phosphate cytidylyltransferase [Candidatus Woesearchaeota archaeon]|nr:glucose-1-phosphate cytidylyltransferase [Candidatus Woesearchaeota archaeon]